jgi:flavin reductase (DIM6/NTAB) family NADH-FMN oxidoreductase RutF
VHLPRRDAAIAAPGFHPDETYQLLRNFTSPIVAVTSAADGERNGMIADSAVRASLAPQHPRIGLFIHKFNHTHALVERGGAFAVHLLRDDQWELIHRLGFASGRDGDKLAGLEHVVGTTGCPILGDCYAAFECRMANRMDAGASTFCLGDILHVWRGTGERVMTASHFRGNLPEAWRAEYEANLRRAQAFADAHAAIAPLRSLR